MYCYIYGDLVYIVIYLAAHNQKFYLPGRLYLTTSMKRCGLKGNNCIILIVFLW